MCKALGSSFNLKISRYHFASCSPVLWQLAVVMIAAMLLFQTQAALAKDAELAETEQSETEPAPDRMDELEERLSGQAAKPQPDDGESSKRSDKDISPLAAPLGALSPEGRQSMQSAWVAYYEYRTHGYEHRKKIFEWQHFSTRIIFWLVLIIVGFGLYFSWVQFHQSENLDELPESKVGITGTGITVSSPVLGVVILSISLAFFYLYLVHVYPILNVI